MKKIILFIPLLFLLSCEEDTPIDVRDNIEGTYAVLGDLYNIDCVLGASSQGTLIMQKEGESNMSIDIGDGIIFTANDFEEGEFGYEFNIPAQTINYDGTLLSIEGAGGDNCGEFDSGVGIDGKLNGTTLLLAIDFWDNEGVYVYWEFIGDKQ